MSRHDSYWEAHKDELKGKDSSEMLKRQQMWRTLSKSENNGFFVWDILEVIGEPFKSQMELYHATQDGDYIYIQCYHFWTLKSAEKFLNDVMAGYQTLYIISERREDTFLHNGGYGAYDAPCKDGCEACS